MKKPSLLPHLHNLSYWAVALALLGFVLGMGQLSDQPDTFLLDWCLSSSVMVLLFLLVRLLLRRRIDPRLQYALWLVVALRLIVPGQWFSLPFSLVATVEEQIPLKQVVEQVTPTVTTTVSLEEGNIPQEVETYWREHYQVFDSTYTQPTAENPNGALELTRSRNLFNFPFWYGLWWAGIMAFAVVVAVTNLLLRRQLKKKRSPAPLETYLSCPLPLYVADNLASPCMYRHGLSGKTAAVYLNRKALDCGHTDHIIAHEVTHYRHGDDNWALLRLLCLALHWYNPLVWWAVALCRRDCELACDTGAIEVLGEKERLEYGRTLLSMVSPGLSLLPLVSTTTTMTSGKRALRDRILSIARKPKVLIPVVVAAAVVLALAIAFTCGGRQSGIALEAYWGTYETTELLYQSPAISYVPPAGEAVVVEEDLFSSTLPTGVTSDISNPSYRPIDFDASTYVAAEFLDGDFNPFPQFETVQAFTIRDGGEELPLHLLVADGLLLLVENPGDEVGCRVWRLNRSPEPLTEDDLLDLYGQAEEAYGWFYGPADAEEAADAAQRFAEQYPQLTAYEGMAQHLSALFAPDIVETLLARAGGPDSESLALSLYRETSPNAGYCQVQATVREDAQPYGGTVTVTTEVLTDSGNHLGEQTFRFDVRWDGENWVFTSFGLWDDVEPNLFHQAQAILENLERDVSRWLYLLRGMDWSILRQVGREQLGMEDPITDVLTRLAVYVADTTALTEADYANILTANRGLDGAWAEAYSAILEELYRRDRSLFELVVTGYIGADGCLDLLPQDIDASTEDADPTGLSQQRSGVYTFLLVGRLDQNSLADTIMLATFDTNTSALDVCNIPRDTMINVPVDFKKISFSIFGGIDAVKEWVQKTTGILPNYYLLFDWEAVENLVDAVGGITYNVPIPLHYIDGSEEGGFTIDLWAGEQRIDGDKAMQLLRWRKNNVYQWEIDAAKNAGFGDGDPSRIWLQQDFLAAAARQILQAENLANLPGLAAAVVGEVETDLPLDTLLQLARTALTLNSAVQLTFHTLPGNWENAYSRTVDNLQSYFVPEKSQVLSLVNNVFNPYTRQITIDDLDLMSVNSDGTIASSTGTVADSAHNEAVLG